MLLSRLGDFALVLSLEGTVEESLDDIDERSIDAEGDALVLSLDGTVELAKLPRPVGELDRVGDELADEKLKSVVMEHSAVKLW